MRSRTFLAVAASAGLLGTGLWPGLLLAPAAAAAHTTINRSEAVRITVQNVSPSTPVDSTKHLPLTVALTLTNTTESPIDKVAVVAERGAPIGNQSALDAALRRTAAPAGSGLRIEPTRPVTVDLPAGGDTNTTFTTTTSLLNDGKGICLCHNAVYPLYFRAVGAGSDGTTNVLGTTSTFLPSFDQRPQPVKVAWVWPLIDRPHRLVFDAVFTDDDLSESVGEGGRLSRALEVVERVGPRVPMTVMIDPELLDELEVMSTRAYTVRPVSGKPAAGRGQQAAAAWLARLRSVLANNPDVQVALTPYADPDVQSLSGADGLSWSSALPAAMSARVATALAGQTPVDVAWPVSTRLDRSALDMIAASGSRTVILDAEAVTASPESSGIPASSARLRTSRGTVAAALTSPAIRSYVGSTVSSGGTGAAALPNLTAELAIRAAQEPQSSHLVVLTAPRYVDPSVDGAERVIRETSSSVSTKPASLRSAVASSLPDTPARLRSVPHHFTRLPAAITADARAIRDSVPTVTSLLENSSDAATLLAALPRAIQRIESSAWRVDSTVGGENVGLTRARTLSAEVATLRSGVRIVRPSSGSYTLASGDSPLPITVVNDLNYAVEVDVEVSAVDNLPGFTARRLDRQRISAHSRQTLRVPTQVQRPGNIRVQAQLRTTSDAPLGDAVPLSVHSTVLGLVGVVITAVAGAVLVIALLIRAGGRFRRRRDTTRGDDPVPSAAFAPQHETTP